MKRPLAFRFYLASLTLALAAVFVWMLAQGQQFETQILAWVAIVGIFVLMESADLLFHHEYGREGLSASDAVLLPLIVCFSFGQAVLGVVIAITVASIIDKRVGFVKGLFNVTELGCAAAVGAAVWSVLAQPAATLTPRNALAAVIAVVAFSLLTHAFVAGVISLAEGTRFRLFSSGISSVLGWNLAGNLILGLFLASSYLAAPWTVVLFPLPLAAFLLGYRAVIRQSSERERVTHLHSATRALASNVALDAALLAFLQAIQEVTSSREAHVFIGSARGVVWSGRRGDEVLADMAPWEGSPAARLAETIMAEGKPLLVTSTEEKTDSHLVDRLGDRSLIAVPILDGEDVAGCLAVVDRVGADDFNPSEVTLMETLANELAMTIDSHRLFEQVSEERERFRKIFDSSKEGIALLDEEARVRAWNPALVRITGYGWSETLGQVWSDFLTVRTGDHEDISGHAITEASPEVELEVVTKEGPSRWISVLSSPVKGQDKGWVVLVRDVTTEHILEESKSDFLSTVSHELRTPLTTIKGSVQVLGRKKDEQSPMQQQMLSVLQRGTDRLERLVLNLLFVSQLDVKEDVKVFVEDMDLVELVRHSVESIAADHSQVEVLLQQDVVQACIDRERTMQVVDHLIENAVKFCPEGLIKVEVGTEDDFAFLTVRDQGPGIPTVDQERIFERFVRLGHVLTRETQGPGVGLFIVKKAVEAMGGAVHLDSKPGEGATFTVTFPVAAARRADIEPQTV